ncbi:hypothetical protein ABG067_005005 [Albugo candida]
MPVLVKQVTKLLAPGEVKVPRYFVDATAGCAGHAQKILESDPNMQMLCIDRDPAILSIAISNLKKFKGRVKFINGSYAELDKHLSVAGFPCEVSGILVDLGVNSLHYDKPERGFSWLRDGPLDMRFDESDSAISTAADVLETFSEVDLTRIFRKYGELKHAKEYAKAIVRKRETATSEVRAFETTFDLRGVIEEVAAKWKLKRPSSNSLPTSRSNLVRPITACFQALRIQVNNELANIHEGIPVLTNHLAPGARLDYTQRLAVKKYIESSIATYLMFLFRPFTVYDSSWDRGLPLLKIFKLPSLYSVDVEAVSNTLYAKVAQIYDLMNSYLRIHSSKFRKLYQSISDRASTIQIS